MTTLAQVVALCVLVGSPSIRASDPVPVRQAPTEDSIAVARQQLDGLKSDSASKAAGISSDVGPSIRVPQLDTSGVTGPTMTLTPTTDTNGAKKKPSKNWLVDGVMKQERADRLDAQTRQRGAGGREKSDTSDSLESSEDSLNQPGESNETDSQTGFSNRSTGRSDRTSRESPEPKDAPKDTFNPLAHYMASWLAPQDYPLLRHAADAPGNSTALPTDNLPSSTALPADASTALPLPGGDLDGADASRSVTPLQSPADNPFLQFLAPPDPALAAAPAPAQQVITPPPTPLLPPPPQASPATPNSTVPDFAKPDTDDKYFKPLKRF